MGAGTPGLAVESPRVTLESLFPRIIPGQITIPDPNRKGMAQSWFN